MLVLGRRANSLEVARSMAESAVANGSAWQTFRRLVAAQGGDVSYVDSPQKMENARFVETVPSPESGFLSQIHARIIGEAAVDLGAGRAKKGDPIDHAVGFEILRKVGDRVEKGQPLFVIHANDAAKLAQARQSVLAAHAFSPSPVAPLPFFYT
jgi:pyrimidine-nucleoside phosphorylase